MACLLLGVITPILNISLINLSIQSNTPAASSADTPSSVLSIEQFFKLLQQRLTGWSQPDGLNKVYPQAIALAQKLEAAYQHQPERFIAQLHQYKPQYLYLTNYTAKAAIFTAIQVSTQQWSKFARVSLIAATFTSNVAVLSLLEKQAAGQPLSPSEKNRINKGAALSYKLLTQHNVLDALWLHSISTSLPAGLQQSYPVGLHGAIVRLANLFAGRLSVPPGGKNLTVANTIKALYLDDSQTSVQHIIDNCAMHLPLLSAGTLALLKNEQLALVMHSISHDSHLVFLCAGQTLGIKGRFVVIGNKHIDRLLPCYTCEDPRLYSLLWGAPLNKTSVEKKLTLNTHGCDSDDPDADIFTPPSNLAGLIAELFSQPSLNKISEQVSQSDTLRQLLTQTASQAASKDVQITDVKHAIAMLGLNRLGPLITQGALLAIVAKQRFPGDVLVDNRQQCFIQAVRYYAQYSDLMAIEEVVLFATFWLAPLHLSKELQSTACRLYRQKPLNLEDMFSITRLFALKLSDNHKQQVMTLAKNWQLPKICLEIFRHLNNPDSPKAAKRVEQSLAVIHLATLHTHTIFSQVDVNSPFLQEKLLSNLKVLDISLKDYLKHQDTFLASYSPFTPLL